MTRRAQRSSLWSTAGLAVVTVVAAVVGAVSGFVHRSTVEGAGVSLPVGLVAALGGLSAVVLLARMLGRSRAAVLLVAAAYTIPVLVLSQFRAEGDLVVAEDAWGLTLLGGSALVVTVGVTVPFSSYDGHRPRRLTPLPPSPPEQA